MMNPGEKRAELVSTARAILDEDIHLIEGVRKICLLRHYVGDPGSEVFMPIRAIESETDHYPLGKVRSEYAQDFLGKLDAEMRCYLEDAKVDIFEACKEIIRVYSETEDRPTRAP
jgi:hypothetical protein